MGYANHAAYELEVKMAKTPETVMAFLNGNFVIYF
jgi:Zn-dependent oligopeptidase